MRRYIRRHKHHYFQFKKWKTRIIFWGGAVIVGIVAAIFALSAEYADHTFHTIYQRWPVVAFFMTPFGLLFTVYLTRRFFPGAEGSGIPQTIIAIEDKGGPSLTDRLLSIRVAIGKIFLSLIGLFCGASLGREGPTVHIGAAIMYNLGKYTHLSARYMKRGLILTGGGAGVAAAFNTPLAGIMFAIEELAREFDRRSISMILIGVILAGMTAIFIHQTNYNYYGRVPAEADLSLLWLAVIVSGVLGGLLGGGFSQILITAGKKIRPYVKDYPYRTAFLLGLVVAVLGVISGGQVYGTGYIEAQQIVSCSASTSCENNVGFMYPVYKLAATTATYLTGIPGGIFAPSLASGAGLGSDLSLLFPAGLATTVVLLGMVGYFSGVVQTPVTAFIIVMEMVDNQDIVFALMATSLIATGASKFVCKKPIYVALAENFMAAMKAGK
ncbi:MAG: chloride channel protein [Gammaproteobacteria bacterium]|nr:chloride channel protein [Gammaproteobacteria bacterium]